WGRLRQEYRHREGETGPAVLTVLGPDASPLRLDDVAGDGEPQARSAALARHVDFVETLKHTRLLTVGDAGSRVRDAESDGPASGLGAGTHDNPATLRCQLNGIGEQVHEHAAVLLPVCPHGRQVPGQISAQRDRF